MEMVAVGNHRAAVRESPIHGSSDPGRDRLHAAAEPIAVASFDDQVNVVALDGVVSEARWASVTECGEGRLERSNEPCVAEVRDVGTHLERHVTGEAACDTIARAVGNASHRADLPASAAPASSPSGRGPQGERQLLRVHAAVLVELCSSSTAGDTISLLHQHTSLALDSGDVFGTISRRPQGRMGGSTACSTCHWVNGS